MIEREFFIRWLSRFIEGDQGWKFFDEFEKNLEEEFCCRFYHTFKKTIELCREIDSIEVPKTAHVQLITLIHETPQNRRISPLKKPKNRKKRK